MSDRCIWIIYSNQEYWPISIIGINSLKLIEQIKATNIETEEFIVGKHAYDRFHSNCITILYKEKDNPKKFKEIEKYYEPIISSYANEVLEMFQSSQNEI